MNPYLLLTIGIAWVFTVGGAYLKGQQDQSNAMLAASYELEATDPEAEHYD